MNNDLLQVMEQNLLNQHMLEQTVEGQLMEQQRNYLEQNSAQTQMQNYNQQLTSDQISNQNQVYLPCHWFMFLSVTRGPIVLANGGRIMREIMLS